MAAVEGVRGPAALRTSVGRVRERNEDAGHIDSARGLYLVADGMGGRNCGDVASAMAVASVRKTLERSAGQLCALAAEKTEQGRAAIRALLEGAIHTANREVLGESRRDLAKHGMGTTLEVVFVAGREAFVAHVGDGRTYLIRDGRAELQTVDHTMAQAMLGSGSMTPNEARVSPLRSVLSNSVGGAPIVVVDHVYIELQAGDLLLMCSDGLYEYFSPDELAERVASAAPGTVLDRLVDEACARGGHDNITGIIIDVDGLAAPADEIDDAITTPFDVPVEPERPVVPAMPFADASEETLADAVEHVLCESSQPYFIPG